MSGNEAIAEGALAAGCRFYAGYPITPQNELIAYMARHMQARGGVFIQAESEIAAINMVFGAAASGVRAMTSSSSPGISLKQEGISYLAGAQLPAVIVNIMRGGPGLGNIEPAQSDYFQLTRGGGHGDYRTMVFAPAGVQEAYDLMPVAFAAADRYRNPVMIAGDGMLGQMMEPVVLGRAFRGKREDGGGKKKEWAVTGCRRRKPNVIKSFFMMEGDLARHNQLLQKKYARIVRHEQRAREYFLDDAKVVLVAYGMAARVALEMVGEFRKKRERVGLLRPVTLWPFPRSVFERLITRGKPARVLVIEMSGGQMVEDVRLTVEGRIPVDFIGRAGGGVPAAHLITRKIAAVLKAQRMRRAR